jgi:excisionase family DNA binding protein
MTLADAPDVLTVQEAARLARVGRNAMYEAVQRGDVWSARIGRSIRIPKAALVAFLHLANEAPTLPASTPQGVDRDAFDRPHRRAS